MAVQFQEDTGQYLLRIGDTVLLYAKEARGYVFSQLTSERHNSVALCKVDSMKDPRLPNIHFATFAVVRANKYKAQERYNSYSKSLKGREPTAEERSKLQSLEAALKLEGHDNELEQERLRGSNIAYGEKVQLQHTLTKKFLSVNTTKISRTENTNLRVELTSHNALGCIFKILPRYKVRSVGDEVRYNDQIKFESVKTEGQFLHCSASEYGNRFTVLQDSRELNLSATESAFTLVPQYRPNPDHSANAFRGGKVVRLFHREYECYLSAEGSFAKQPPVVENVHCRKRHSDRGRLKEPSTSANVYWQFEKEADPHSGEPLYWGERCRIKHLPTRLYLTVLQHQDGFSVSLKERAERQHMFSSTDQNDLDTVFSLFPVIQEGDTILTESYARIKHLQTDTWLHLEKGNRYQRLSFNPDAPGLDGLQWDSAELYMLTATKTMNYDDAFTLESVSDELVDKFNHVAGIVPVLTTHIGKYGVMPKPPSLDIKSAYLVESALADLACYLDNTSPRETKNRQKLLRNLLILELVIEILGLFSADAPDKEAQRTVCKECYSVIKSYLNGDSRKNENYLARFIPFFKKQVNMGLNAEEVMIEMVENNNAIVSRVAATELAYMIDQLVTQKDPRFMEFLGNLCVCASRPILDTQKTILNELVVNHGQEVFYRLEVGVSRERPNAEDSGIYVQLPKSDEWRSLEQIASKEGDETDECAFLESQLGLFARLCRGNNSTAIRTLGENELGWVTFNLVLGCAQNSYIRPSLRMKFIELMIVMYVDVGNNRNVLENLSLSFVYKEVVEDPYKDTGKADTVAFTGEENLHFPAMRDWILQHITVAAERGVIAEECDDNYLLADVLIVLKQLVKYGYYDDAKDVDTVMKPLTKILSGFHDELFSKKEHKKTGVVGEAEKTFQNSGRYLENDDNKPVFEIKKRCIEVMDLFLNFRFYIRLQRFIYDFKLLKESIDKEHDKKSVTSLTSQLLARMPDSDTVAISLEQLLQLTPKEILHQDNCMLIQLAGDRLKYLFSLSEYYIEKDECESAVGQRFPALLLDLANYYDDELIQESLHLLNRFYSAEITLFQKAIQTELIHTEESHTVLSQVIHMELPTIRRNMSIDAGSQERAAIIEALKRLTSMCSVEEDATLAHGQNQKILFNSGVMSDVINYVLHTSKHISIEMVASPDTDLLVGDSSGGADIPSVFVECFRFLKALAKDNIVVQRRIYECMEVLLDVDIAVSALGELLSEVFTGGTEICLKVTEAQVERLFSLIVQKGEKGRKEFILALQSMAKVESLDLPVKRNQAFIIKYFSKTRDKFCDHILGETEANIKDRERLLEEAESTHPDLSLLLAMTDLLASCAEGENLFIESVCQKIFSVEELLTILNSPRLSCERKRPFARFLVSIYMDTASDKHSSGATHLSHDDMLWAYLDHVGDLLKNILIQIAPASPEAALAMSCRKSVPYVTGEDGRILPGVLLYLTDGILPLLFAFYDVFFELPGSGKPKQLEVTGKVLTALLYLCDPLTTHLSTDGQIKLYRHTVLTILSQGKGKIPHTIEESAFTNFDLKTKSCRACEAAAMTGYNATYAVELELNKAFHSFVTNYQLSYQGQNSAKVQVGSKYDNDYSDFLDKDLSQPGDEYLPLGKSFQEHVACFLNLGKVSPSVERLLCQLEISFRNLETSTEKERQRQDELDIKCLQIMRAIIHNEIVQIDPELREDSPSVYRRKCVSRVHPRQNAIQDFKNAVARVVPMMSHPNDAVISEVLAFLKAMFFSGNRHVQEGMEHLLETREERLLSTVQSLLQNAAVTFNERRALLTQLDHRIASDQLLQTDIRTLLTPPNSDNQLGIHEEWRSKPTKMASDSIAIDVEEEDALMDSIVTFKPPHKSDSSLLEKEHSPPSWPHDPPVLKSTKRTRSSSKIFTEECELKALAPKKDGTIQLKTSGTTMDSESLAFHDTHHVKLTLEVLGLMCDGQYRLIQNYLREQKDNIVTIDVVAEVSMFLQHFYTNINADTMDLVHLILQTLIEMCVGNYPNQEVIYSMQIVEALNSILAIDIADPSIHQFSIVDGINLKASAIELLEAMLEETDRKTKELAQEIAGSLDVGALHDTLCDFRALMQDRRVKDAHYDDNAEGAMFRTYHCLVYLTHYEVPAETVEPKKEEKDKLYEAWEYCKRWSRSVEVFYKNMDGDKVLTKVLFPFNPDHELREAVIEKVKWNVNRDSPEDKLRDYLEWMKAVKHDTMHHARLHKFSLTRVLTNRPEHRHYLLILWSLAMCILLLLSFQVQDSRETTYDLDAPNNTVFTFFGTVGALLPGTLPYMVRNGMDVFTVLLFLGGTVHLILTLWFVIEYFVINWPNFKLPRLVYHLLSKWREPPEESYSDVPIFGLMTVYVVFFLHCSVLSLAYRGYFYCFCLLHVIVNNDILQRVLRSITKNGRSLIWVAILGVIVFFIYAVVSFAFLHESFRAENNNDGDLFCSTLYECFASTVRYGLLDNLGLLVPLVPSDDFRVYALRLIYDVSFFIIVTTIGLNIVFGIIVDTFSELRDERFRTEQDKKAVCFICGLPSHEFERRAKGFNHHVKHDHNMWTYIYYSIYLDTIDISDHNAIQSFVYNKIRDGQLDFFPLLGALALEKEEDEKAVKLDELQRMVESVLRRFKKEDYEKSRHSKLQDQKQWEETHLRKEPSPETHSQRGTPNLDHPGQQPLPRSSESSTSSSPLH